MPKRTYIVQKDLPGQKPMIYSLTVMLCADASGECKTKLWNLEYYIIKSQLNIVGDPVASLGNKAIFFKEFMKCLYHVPKHIVT